MSIKCQHRLINRVSTNRLDTWLIQRVLDGSHVKSDHQLVEHIVDINLRAAYLLDQLINIENCSTAIRLIRSTLLFKENNRLKQGLRKQLTTWLQNINVYAEIASKFQRYFKKGSILNWRDIMRMSEDKPERILEILMKTLEFSLCMKWCSIHPMAAKEDKIKQFAEIFTDTIQRLDSFQMDLFQLMATLPMATVLSTYTSLITTVHNIPILRFMVDFLQANEPIDRRLVHKVNVSLTIFEMSDTLRPNWYLLQSPLLIIEQYLMNSHFDALARVIHGVRSVLGTEPCSYCFEHRVTFCNAGLSANVSAHTFSDSVCDEFVMLHNEFSQHREHSLSTDCVDSLLRIYASKALDFRVVSSHTSSDDLHSQVTDQTMASMDSLLSAFIMPREAPTRSNWIRDDEASHCMSCRQTVFTMLTRRHHCRQCGRVVCHACSSNRALIPSLYADVRVRVCDDCHRQMKLDTAKMMSSSSNTAGSSSPYGSGRLHLPHGRGFKDSDEWLFSGNLRHDELLRVEFGYEFAPSVSLCLSILALHSIGGPECANFLLLHCGKFESLLRPLQPGQPNSEIDYALVTRMLHCLALAAKVSEFYKLIRLIEIFILNMIHLYLRYAADHRNVMSFLSMLKSSGP